eukprot:scaffold22589_cov138-Cylindrotheca_fusiformis.AAC.57
MPPFADHTLVDRYTPCPHHIGVDDTLPEPARTPGRIGTDSDWSTLCPNLFGQRALGVEKRVQFALEQSTLHDVLHVRDYSHDELRSTWFSLEELKEMKRSSKRVIQDTIRGAKGYCLRGLEGRTNEQAKWRRKQKKADVRFSVLTEQAKQKYMTGTTDQERIATVSLRCTKHCRHEAERVGLQDEKEAISVIMESCELEEGSILNYDCSGILLSARR